MPECKALFDEQAQALHQARSAKAQELQLYQAVRHQIEQRLGDIKREFTAPCLWQPAFATPNKGDPSLRWHDEQTLFDLILSCLQLQHENDMEGALRSIYARLEKGGLFLGALIGGQSLCELRACLMEAEIDLTGGASPRVAPMLDKEDAANLLARTGFALPVLDHERFTLAYRNLGDLMQDLRAGGCTNALTARPRSFTSRRLFDKAQEIYAARFPAEGGGITATIDVLFLHGWKEE